jgi:hypothetical protein
MADLYKKVHGYLYIYFGKKGCAVKPLMNGRSIIFSAQFIGNFTAFIDVCAQKNKSRRVHTVLAQSASTNTGNSTFWRDYGCIVRLSRFLL